MYVVKVITLAYMLYNKISVLVSYTNGVCKEVDNIIMVMVDNGL